MTPKNEDLARERVKSVLINTLGLLNPDLEPTKSWLENASIVILQSLTTATAEKDKEISRLERVRDNYKAICDYFGNPPKSPLTCILDQQTKIEMLERQVVGKDEALRYFKTWGEELNRLLGYKATPESWAMIDKALSPDACQGWVKVDENLPKANGHWFKFDLEFIGNPQQGQWCLWSLEIGGKRHYFAGSWMEIGGDNIVRTDRHGFFKIDETTYWSGVEKFPLTTPASNEAAKEKGNGE